MSRSNKLPEGFERVFMRASRALADHAAVFAEQVAQAERLERRGKLADATVAARVAADFASTNHPGVYASPELEALLTRVGEGLRLPPVRAAGRPARGKEHVLHVFSAAYDIGGHTRLVWRWIGRDARRTHSVVITHQRNLTPPPPLREAVRRSGGQLYRLDARPSGLFGRAERLAALSRRADLVVLHTHPFDVIPALAFSKDLGVPVVLFNQADHVFWLSRNAARLVVSFRASGADLALRRRGVPAANSALLPLPLELPTRGLTRAGAKAQLGLPAATKVIFSVALPYKYTAMGALDFPRIFAEFAREQDATVLVVGPERDARWGAAETASGGRVRALGRRADLSLFHQAADLYVDSFPFGSATSLLEAGSYGVPVLTLSPFAEASVMRFDDPALADEAIVCTDEPGYRARLAALLSDDALREREGREAARNIARVHTGAAWLGQLEAVYARAAAAPPMPPLTEAVRAADAPDLLVAALNLLAGRSRTPEGVFTEHLQLLPLGSRTRHVLGSRGRERPGRLLSDWLGQQYEFVTGRGRQAVSG